MTKPEDLSVWDVAMSIRDIIDCKRIMHFPDEPWDDEANPRIEPSPSPDLPGKRFGK